MSSKSRFKSSAPKAPTAPKIPLEINAQLNLAYERVVMNAAILIGADARNRKLHQADPNTDNLANIQNNAAMEASMALEHLLGSVGALNLIMMGKYDQDKTAAESASSTATETGTEPNNSVTTESTEA